MKSLDYVIVGAGLAGCVCAERLASVHGRRVLIVERRGHIGGNAYDAADEHGVLVHVYGPHIFHTKMEHVWRYLSQFTEWRPYQHRVLGFIDGKNVPLPFNLTALRTLFPRELAARIEDSLVRRFGFGSRVPILELRAEKNEELHLLADYVYRKVFLNYTTKQWGLPPEELSPSVTSRIPVVVGTDDRYFSDPWQGMPLHGYTALFQRMLDNRNIKILLNTDYREVATELAPRRLIYTGMVDELLDLRYGPLPYRSLEFRNRNLRADSFQEAATVNYPNEYDYTRVTEYRKLTGQKADSTTVAFEYPRPRKTAADEAYYPIPRDENAALYERYRADAAALTGVRFVGRLAQYAYLNMDQVVDASLKCVEEMEAP